MSVRTLGPLYELYRYSDLLGTSSTTPPDFLSAKQLCKWTPNTKGYNPDAVQTLLSHPKLEGHGQTLNMHVHHNNEVLGPQKYVV